ncbi:hypothetical protein HBI56_231060 [Parastagonospora nodorum]|uniref:Secreted protein n=1 Tax=Phaeosphaeria nodorum (strain SN15 / ATCC MYA-4574 / FGSC 10173) TaxID=321614 RepID=A0A7U2I8E0_PHANO|nr:hypothetical protein HBH56_224000 [Parastagonospora nodorum]QRD04323.1 hypothetical protein JI435_420970 [Parastagonospora nodorum SN15]KAH3921899.1 hypothetical protein HBH54_232150 [Parastagonospora nodorum]KAH3957252.1 hypothetical protein HBH51_228020 [Parastagonospora nodorum]KAH3991770.1 hypothetical protein HBI10_228420 [Parastagonospora nodorum]
MGSFLSGLFSVLILLVRFNTIRTEGRVTPDGLLYTSGKRNLWPHFHVPSTGNKLDQSTWHTRIQDWLPRS